MTGSNVQAPAGTVVRTRNEFWTLKGKKKHTVNLSTQQINWILTGLKHSSDCRISLIKISRLGRDTKNIITITENIWSEVLWVFEISFQSLISLCCLVCSLILISSDCLVCSHHLNSSHHSICSVHHSSDKFHIICFSNLLIRLHATQENWD